MHFVRTGQASWGMPTPVGAHREVYPAGPTPGGNNCAYNASLDLATLVSCPVQVVSGPSQDPTFHAGSIASSSRVSASPPGEVQAHGSSQATLLVVRLFRPSNHSCLPHGEPQLTRTAIPPGTYGSSGALEDAPIRFLQL